MSTNCVLVKGVIVPTVHCYDDMETVTTPTLFNRRTSDDQLVLFVNFVFSEPFTEHKSYFISSNNLEHNAAVQSNCGRINQPISRVGGEYRIYITICRVVGGGTGKLCVCVCACVCVYVCVCV